MKYKKIMLVSLILLAILTIGAVSAEEQIALENDTIAASDDSVDVLADDDGEHDYYYDAEIPDAVYEFNTYDDDAHNINLQIPWEHDGNVSVLIDNSEKYNENTTYYGNEYKVDLLPLLEGMSYGKHNIVLNYFGDSYYNNFTCSKSITYDFILFDVPETAIIDQSNDFKVTVPDTVEGSLTLYINNKKYETYTIEYGEAYIYYSPETFEKINYKLEFKDSNGKYPTRSVQGSINTTFYFNVYSLTDEYNIGESADFEIYLPSDATGYIEISYNGKSKKVAVETEDMTFVKIDDLKMGENNITFKYTYKKQTRTIIKNIKVNPIIKLDNEVRYNSDDGLYLKIPADVKGDIEVYVDDVKINGTLKDGELKVVLSGYDAKESHTLVYNYTGDDYEIEGSGVSYGFCIVPNVYYPKHVWISEDFEVTIEMPEDGNGTFTFYKDWNTPIASVPVINGSATITVPKNSLHTDENNVYFNYDGNYNSLDMEDAYIVGHNQPKNVTLEIECQDTLIKGGNAIINNNLPWDVSGYITVYLNGEKLYKYSVENEIERYMDANEFISKLDFGTYNFTFEYSGDDYYLASSQSKLINVGYYELHLQEPVTLGDNDRFFMEISPAAPRVAKLYIDDKMYQVGEVAEHDGMYVNWVGIHFDLSGLSCKEYNNVKLVYEGDKNYPGFTKYLKFNVTYSAIIEETELYYKGEYTELNVTFGADLKGNASVIIDDKTYTAEIKNQTATFNIESFIGEKTVTIKHAGDGSYPEISSVQTITISPIIESPGSTYVEETGKVTLILPKDAKGNLTVKLIKTNDETGNEIIQEENVALVDGKAEVTIKELPLGEYCIETSYTGDDYDVESDHYYYSVSPNITAKDIYVGEEFKFLFEMPEDAGGILKVHVSGQEDDFEQELVNGKANFTLKGLGYGDYYYTYTYTGGKYGSITTEDEREGYFNVNKYPANFTQTAPKEIIANYPFKLTFKAQDDLTGDFYVYIGNEEASTYIQNGVGTVSIKSTQPGNVTVRYYYDGDNRYESDGGQFTISVLNPVKLTANDQTVYYSDGSSFKVKVYDSFGKLVGAGQAVTFYIDGKKVSTVKTAKNGVASLKINKLPKTYKIKAAYKGASITKKLTVKQVLTLKTAKVKKSAKKLVLTATLKKGKKAISKKVITFKFKGKAYKAKTNKYGIAKVTIPKSVLSKLKAGQKITYTATYVKTTVKKTVKVQK